MALCVDVAIEGSTAVVRRRRTHAASAGSRPERFDGADVGDALGRAVRGATLLRTLRTVRLRLVLETPRVLIAVESAPHPARRPDDPRTSRALAQDADRLSAPVRTAPQADGSIVSVRLPHGVLDGIARGLARRRFAGTLELELGPLSRARYVAARVRERVGDRPGLLIDVTRTTLSVLCVRGPVIDSVHVVPAADLRAALSSAAGPALAAASTARAGRGSTPGPPDVRPWLHLAAPPPLRAGVRSACAELLPPGSDALDLVALSDQR